MFRLMDVKDLKDNLIHLIGRETMLISAGTGKDCNTMTASWGFMGEMWGKDCAAIVVRDSRYTLEYLNRHDTFSLCFFGDNKEIPAYCGSVSGRDTDKIKGAGLTPVDSCGTVYFKEARLVMICKKLFVQKLAIDRLTDPTLSNRWYPDGDAHNLFIGSIERIYCNEGEETDRKGV